MKPRLYQLQDELDEMELALYMNLITKKEYNLIRRHLEKAITNEWDRLVEELFDNGKRSEVLHKDEYNSILCKKNKEED
jgi:hypothetical protein